MKLIVTFRVILLMDLMSFAATGIINSLCENPIFNAKYASLIIFNIQQV